MLKIEDLQGITQEEYEKMYTEDTNKFIGERLARNTEKVTQEIEAKYSGYVSKEKYDEVSTKLTDYENKFKQQEAHSLKVKIAHEYKIPYEMADRLSGDDEKSIREDAEIISKFMSQKNTPIQRNHEAKSENNGKEKYLSLLEGMKD